MIRYGLGFLVAAGAVSAGALVACGEDSIDDGNGQIIPSAGGATGAGGGGPAAGGSTGPGSGGAVSAGCVGECCPEAAECYVSGKTGPGAECLARRDNPKEGGKIQMRQTWIRPTAPVGNTADLVYGALNAYTQLDQLSCYSRGQSGYIQMIDFDLSNADATKHVSRVGYAKYVPTGEIANVTSQGLCMVDQVYPVPGTEADDTWALETSEMSPTTGWHPSLIKPMGRKTTPWRVQPTNAVRIAEDFTLDAAGRTALLDRLNPTTGDLGMQGYNGVFHYNPTTGVSHGFGLIAYLIIYDTPTTFIVVPIREAETRSTFNDPEHPNCVGAFRSGDLDPENGCLPSALDQVNTAWGCANGSCPAGQGPATTHGYFMITELEQIYSTVLGSTLCYSYPGATASNDSGWGSATNKFCKTNPAWDPSDMTAGLPMGDWCAATNSEATPACHDAYRSISYHTFQGFNIKDGTCGAL